MQLHLHNGVQSRLDFPQLQEEQFPEHLHLISSLEHFETSGIVIHKGVHPPSSVFFHP